MVVCWSARLRACTSSSTSSSGSPETLRTSTVTASGFGIGFWVSSSISSSRLSGTGATVTSRSWPIWMTLSASPSTARPAASLPAAPERSVTFPRATPVSGTTMLRSLHGSRSKASSGTGASPSSTSPPPVDSATSTASSAKRRSSRAPTPSQPADTSTSISTGSPPIGKRPLSRASSSQLSVTPSSGGSTVTSCVVFHCRLSKSVTVWVTV